MTPISMATAGIEQLSVFLMPLKIPQVSPFFPQKAMTFPQTSAQKQPHS